MSGSTPLSKKASDSPSIPSDKPLIDHSVFDQILGMDDDDQPEFSKSILRNFFDQAVTTFREMQEAMYI